MTNDQKRMLTIIGEQLARIIDLEAQISRADEIIRKDKNITRIKR